jgi:dihydroorotate dehydrogenase (NAD+) catalytic subunit
MAGAAAVEVGTATFAYPPAMTEIAGGIFAYMKKNGIKNIKGLSIRKEFG